MKLMKKTNTYKASNVTFNATTLDAFSYSWWRFVAIVEGKLVFNNYQYSSSTGKHQSKVRRLMNDLGIKIDISLPIPSGIKSDMTLAEIYEETELYLCNQYLKDEIKREERNEKNRLKRLEKKANQTQTLSA